MRFGILGPFEVTDDAGRPVDIGGHRVRALLAMLLLDAGRPVGVPRLVDGLWGAEPPAGTGNALQSVVSRLRSALEPVRPAGERGRLVESGPAGYRLAVDPGTVDAHRFDALTAAGRRRLTDGDPAGAATTLAEALALWRGPALTDLADAPFAPAAAARLAEARLAAAEDHAEAALAAGRAADILGELTTLADQHPLRERLCGLLVRALYAAGRQADALAAYQRTRTALAENLGVDPSPDLRAVQLAVLRQDAALAPPAPAGRPEAAQSPPGADGRRAGNLRAQLTSFVGRDVEVTRIGKTLADARLVTLVGPGGAGKTRLATEAAARLDSPPDGIWLAELAPVSDPVDLPYAVADALGVRDTALLTGRREPVRVHTADPLDVLVGNLAGRRLLLVLDNCEHLVDAAARLVDRLLAGCRDVRVLATSREPLGITGEMLFPVHPLAEPPADADPAEALTYPAVRLFADRGVAARPDFAVHPGTVAATVRICRRLDGMPLAIELAAARLRALPVDQIAARLDDRFGLLTAGSRTALPRHQTLRAVVEWSWDLLGERECALVRRLSVFPAGATLDAAEQVCAGPGLAATDVFDTLAALVDKSLVEASGGGPGEPPRYRMLETIRTYAAERLIAAGEDGSLRRAHARYFLDLAETADPKLRGPDQVVWMRRLAAEQENLHAVLRWAIDTPDPELALRLAGALMWHWVLRGHHTESVSWARQILDAVGEQQPPPGQMANYVACQIGARLDSGWLNTLPAAINEGLHQIAETGEAEPRTPLFMMLRLIAAMLDGPDSALEHLFDEWQADPDPWMRAFARSARGGIGVNQGRVVGAVEDLEAGLAACRAVGDRWAIGQTLNALAELAGYAGDNARAVALLDEAEALVGELGASGEVHELIVRRAVARARAGDLATARAEVAEARRQVTVGTDPPARVLICAAEADLARRAGDLAHAEHCCADALADFGPDGAGTPPQLRAVIRCTQAALALTRGDLDRARQLAMDALSDPAVFVDHPVVAVALETLAGIALADDDPARAAVLLGAAGATRGTDDLGNPEVVAVTEAARRALGPAYAECYQRGAGLDRHDLFVLIGLPEVPADGQTLRR